MYVGVHVCVCTYGMRVWVHVWVCYVCVNSPPFLCAWLRVTAIADSSVLSELSNRWFRFVFVMGPIY